MNTQPMQLDTALHVFLNRESYTEDRVASAAVVISAEMKSKPRLLTLLAEKPAEYSNMTISELVDELGLLHAQADNLKKTQENIKKMLRATGNKYMEGKLYQVTIGEGYTKTTISLDKVEKEAPSLMLKLTKYLKFSTVTGAVNVRARG
jgi:hypothetical protein